MRTSMTSIDSGPDSIATGTNGESDWMLWDEDMEKYVVPLCDLLCACEE